MSVTVHESLIEERFTMKARFPDNEDCALCLQSMKGSLTIRLPCGHHYHEKCHARLRNTVGSYRYRCPTCRHDVKNQTQRLKIYELWGDELWLQERNLTNRIPPWTRPSSKFKIDAFERWIFEGLSEDELFELIENNTQPVYSPPISPISSALTTTAQSDDTDVNSTSVESDEYWEHYFASLILESDEDDSQPDSP